MRKEEESEKRKQNNNKNKCKYNNKIKIKIGKQEPLFLSYFFFLINKELIKKQTCNTVHERHIYIIAQTQIRSNETEKSKSKKI